MKKIICLMVVAALCIGFAGRYALAAESPEEFYKKNTVTLIVASAPGAGADFSGRLIAAYWKDVTGGTMEVKNIAGGGGIAGINAMNAAKPDGLTMGLQMYSGGFLVPQLTKNPTAQYDITKLNFVVGGFGEPVAASISIKSPHTTIQDLQKAKGLKMGSLAVNSGPAYISTLMFRLLNLDAKIVTGYASGAEVNLAMGRGEIDIELVPLAQAVRGFEAGNNKRPFAVFADKRLDALPDIPAFPELVQMTPEQRDLYDKVVDGVGSAIRMVALPPGVDPARVAYVRQALAKVLALPALVEQSKTSFPFGTTSVVNEELDAFIAQSLTLNMEELEAMHAPYLSIR